MICGVNGEHGRLLSGRSGFESQRVSQVYGAVTDRDCDRAKERSESIPKGLSPCYAHLED